MDLFWKEKSETSAYEILNSPVSTIYSIEEKSRYSVSRRSNSFPSYGQKYYGEFSRSQNIVGSLFRKLVGVFTGRGTEDLKILSLRNRERRSISNHTDKQCKNGFTEIINRPQINKDKTQPILTTREMGNSLTELYKSIAFKKAPTMALKEEASVEQDDCVSVTESCFSHSFHPHVPTTGRSSIAKSVTFTFPLAQYIDDFIEDDELPNTTDDAIYYTSDEDSTYHHLLSSPDYCHQQHGHGKNEQCLLHETGNSPEVSSLLSDNESLICTPKYRHQLFGFQLDELDSLLIEIDRFRHSLTTSATRILK